jgi:hypothetical protein
MFPCHSVANLVRLGAILLQIFIYPFPIETVVEIGLLLHVLQHTYTLPNTCKHEPSLNRRYLMWIRDGLYRR